MGRRRRADLPAGVTELRERTEQWRLTRVRGSRMPGALWSDAVALAQGAGVSPIARGLRIDFDGLKRRVAAATSGAVPAGAPSAFVELTGAEIVGTPPTPGTIVEVTDDAGSRLTVRLAAEAELDVARLISAFRHHRA